MTLSQLLLHGILFTFTLITCFPTNCAQLKSTTQPEVTIPQGTLLGTTLTTRNGRNISAFLKIPFAQPPIGNLRFANPVAAEGWNGTLDASSSASMCVQGFGGEEDCLYAKVYSPQDSDSSLLPVMVYIHGGGFQGESPPFSGPEYLLDADVVLVTMNYRLGVLGFLSTGDEVASGNWGLKDQVLALEWVRDNIKYFGGDPDRVTIFGESAGAVSVHLLTLSNSTIGLFHKYITQSGSALADWAHQPRATYSKKAFIFGNYLGCPIDTSDSLIRCLRTTDLIDITSNGMQFDNSTSLAWGPTDEPDIPGAFLLDSPANLFAAGKIRDLPWMSGIVRDEGLLMTIEYYVDDERLYNLLENIDTLLPEMMDWSRQSDSGAAWTSAVKSFYFNNDLASNKSELLASLTQLFSDWNFHYPARKALEKHHALAASPQHFYSFNYRGTWSFSYEGTGNLDNYGVKHADDLIYLFPKDLLFSQFNETMSEKDYQMVDRMVQLWTSFAINGTPTASALGDGITWEPYSAEDKYLRIGSDSDIALEMQSSFFPERMQFWSNLDKLQSADSHSVTLSPNFFLLLLAVRFKFFP